MGSISHPIASPTESARLRLLRVLDRAQKAAAEFLSPERQQELISIRRKFQESRFYLVFLGQFKRGKTTLINSFLGRELLPTGVLPLTSIVTIVSYGATPSARVRFASGNSDEILLEELPAYVTECGNPRNKKGVREVEVFDPAPLLESGVCLVDTPGIGSAFEHNTQAAYEFVPRVDAAIFIFSPESPLSQTELDFLHHIRAHVEKIFLFSTKRTR